MLSISLELQQAEAVAEGEDHAVVVAHWVTVSVVADGHQVLPDSVTVDVTVLAGAVVVAHWVTVVWVGHQVEAHVV